MTIKGNRSRENNSLRECETGGEEKKQEEKKRNRSRENETGDEKMKQVSRKGNGKGKIKLQGRKVIDMREERKRQ